MSRYEAREVWRAGMRRKVRFEQLQPFEQDAFECSPNFLSASCLDIRTAEA